MCPGVGRVPPVLAGGGGTYGETPRREAPDDALHNVFRVLPPLVHRDGDLRAQLGSRDLRAEPFQGVRLGIEHEGPARGGARRNGHGRRQGDYKTFLRIAEDSMSMTKMVAKMTKMIADTRGYSNILNDDCSS